jgi:hypothetical protein
MMTLVMTMTHLTTAQTEHDIALRKLRYLMKLKIREIVLAERRPFCYSDFIEFEVGGEKYHMDKGTIRNYISEFKKSGEIERAFKSKPAFYTIPGSKFDKSMTLDHMGVSSIINDSLLRQTSIYKWLKNRPTKKQSLHNIRLTFVADGIWKAFSNTYANKINPDNKDIMLPSSIFFDYIDILVTIHHTDTVSVAVSCSFRPIVINLPDFLQLYEALARTEMYLAYEREKSRCTSNIADVPSFRTWTVKMWHFGVDTIDEYTGDEFNITFEEGMSDLYRIYVKRMKDGKKRVRTEHQQYPNQKVEEAVRKLFPDGWLINYER